ncbi:MR-MLE domain-containing protein [Fusarium sp. LHS14.1]|nr:MR-MLE domain-containing protein [Fusarium sp. LHS14.1]
MQVLASPGSGSQTAIGINSHISATQAYRLLRVLGSLHPANGGFTVKSALRILRLLPEGLDLSFETPSRTWREYLSLRRRTNIPIIHNELTLTDVSMVQMIADDAGEGINLKIQKFSGLNKARRVRDLYIGFAPLIHLSQTIPDRAFRCVLASHDILAVKTADGPFDIVDGFVTAPAVPGLGITPQLDVLGEPAASYF